MPLTSNSGLNFLCARMSLSSQNHGLRCMRVICLRTTHCESWREYAMMLAWDLICLALIETDRYCKPSQRVELQAHRAGPCVTTQIALRYASTLQAISQEDSTVVWDLYPDCAQNTNWVNDHVSRGKLTGTYLLAGRTIPELLHHQTTKI